MEDTPQNNAMSAQQHLRARPQIKIVRPSQRRKFLVGLLGGAAIVAVGSSGIGPFMQNMRLAMNTKYYPYHLGDSHVPDSFSPDFNLMAMINAGEENDSDAKLYIWDYQQQHMIVLSTGYGAGEPACILSPDNRYFVFQTENSLDMWDMRTRQKIHSYTGDSYMPFSEIHWLPDGSHIALRSSQGEGQHFWIMDLAQFTPLVTFNIPAWTSRFALSPDGQSIAFLEDDTHSPGWNIRIRDLKTFRTTSSITLQSQQGTLPSYTLLWSPDGKRLVARARNEIRIIELADAMRSYSLGNPGFSSLLAWSPDGRYLAVNIWQLDANIFGAGNNFYVWDAVERKVARSYDLHSTSEPQALGWSKDGKHIIVIGTLYSQENWDWP